MNALTASRALVSDGSGLVAVAATTATEIGYVNGVTSAIQTQIDGKEPTVSLTASRAVVSSAGGALAVATTTSAEIGFVNGVTSAIQTQLDAKLALAGGTMTGALTLSGAPTTDLHASTKKYVDDNIGGGSGAWTVLSSAAFSAVSSVDLDGLVTGSYYLYLFFYRFVPNTDDVQVWVRFDSDSGASYETSGYTGHIRGFKSGAETSDNHGSSVVCAGASGGSTSVGNNTNEGSSGWLAVRPATNQTWFWGEGTWANPAGALVTALYSGQLVTSAVTDSLQLLPESGTITGEYTLVGLANS